MRRRWPSYRRALPAEHPDIAASLYNLGRVQSDLREYAAARKSQEEALAICRKALPKDHSHIARIFMGPRVDEAWSRVSMSGVRSPSSPRRPTCSLPTRSG